MDIEISLTGPEREYVDQQIRAGRAGSEGEVLREALQFRIDHGAEEDRNYAAWRDETRRTIELRYQRALEGGFVDGEAAFERVRIRMEQRFGANL
jgi:Arc/MetJ-type ribon-helix-helix transcriptional regulator